MEIPYEFEQCIICLENPCGDWEHVIPEFIGGRLKGRMLCDSCNHAFGSLLVSKLKTDPSIRLAIEALKNKLPDLYNKMQRKATYTGIADDSSKIRATNTKNGIKILDGQGIDGSLILDTDNAQKALKKKLERFGISSEELEEWVQRFTQLKEDIAFPIPTGEIFVKRKTPSLNPELNIEKVSDRLLALIAFEFLSLIIGSLIYRPSFNAIRQFVQNNHETELITVKQFQGGGFYDTFNGIFVTPIENAIRVDIRFFRWVAYVVTFYGFEYKCFDSVYYEDLQNHESCFALTQKDYDQGKIWIYK